MRYNIVLNDVAKNIVCSSFNRGTVSFAGDSVFSTAQYMIFSINKPAIGIELNDPVNNKYLLNSPIFVDQLSGDVDILCNQTVSLTVSAMTNNNQPIAFIRQIKKQEKWPLITDTDYSSYPQLGTQIANNYYSYTFTIDPKKLNLQTNQTYKLRILAAPVNRWDNMTTDSNNISTWTTLNTAIKSSPWTSSSVININIKDC
jgi:hypothetical protein